MKKLTFILALAGLLTGCASYEPRGGTEYPNTYLMPDRIDGGTATGTGTSDLGMASPGDRFLGSACAGMGTLSLVPFGLASHAGIMRAD